MVGARTEVTAVIFVLGLVAAYAHWRLAPVGWLLFGNLTIYVALFVATLSSASVASLFSKNFRCISGALVLIINFVGSHYAWTTSDPLLIDGINNTVSAAWFILTGRTRWELGVGGLLLAAAATAVLSHVGIIPDHLNRDNTRFIAWSYPDIVAVLGHFCNILLGVGAGDAGRRVRVALAPWPLVFTARRDIVARLVSVEKVKKEG